jgi:hypothetical protein
VILGPLTLSAQGKALALTSPLKAPCALVVTFSEKPEPFTHLATTGALAIGAPTAATPLSTTFASLLLEDDDETEDAWLLALTAALDDELEELDVLEDEGALEARLLEEIEVTGAEELELGGAEELELNGAEELELAGADELTRLLLLTAFSFLLSLPPQPTKRKTLIKLA